MSAASYNSPKQSNYSGNAMVPARKGGFPSPKSMSSSVVQIHSNQFKLKISQNTAVYQYTIDIKPDELWEADRVHAIIKTKRSSLEKALGPFVVSGKIIYVLAEIDDSIEFTTTYRGQRCSIKIDKDYGQQVMLSDDFINKENSVSQNLLNVIIKQAFRETKLKQLGRSPRFFDMDHAIELPNDSLRIWEGFKASAF